MAQGGSDVAVAVGAQDADGEVAQTGHGAWCSAGADLGGVLGEGDVAEVTTLRVRCSMRPWPRSRSRVGIRYRDQVPGQVLAAGQQGGLVGLDREQVVGLLVGDQNSAASG
jgi:hypothetical protein